MIVQGQERMVTDPVCGMSFPVGQAFAVRHVDGREIHLCSSKCADTFDAARVHYPASDTWAHHEAGRAAIARGAGSRLDPDLVRVYLHLLDGQSCS